MNYEWTSLGNANSLKEVLTYIMQNKNMSKDEILSFIKCTKGYNDPYLLTNMDKAVKRIQLAKERGEKIVIFGDYDADGVTSTSVLFIALRFLGLDVIWYLPNRFIDGYGMNTRIIDLAISEGAQLGITVDNGIAAHEQIKYANEHGLEIIVTDHHEFEADELPTEITIDPKIDDNYPFKGICGCMVAFKLVQALIPDLEENHNDLYKELVSITTIGTIADVMDIVDENRYLVKQGLEYIQSTKNIGLRNLLKESKLWDKVLKSENIGFNIGPCINAAGRLDSPDIGVHLLLSDDDIESTKLAQKLIKFNETRKELQEEVVKNLVVSEEDKIIIIVEENIGHGILGIIAGKIAEKYQKPCFVLGYNKETGKLSGSGRSILDYNLFSLIDNNRDIVGGGGHAAACGINLHIDNLEEFRRRCNKDFSEWLENSNIEEMIPTKEALCEVNFGIIDKKLIDSINRLQPFGTGNPEPLFITRNVCINKYKIVGQTGNAMQLVLSDDYNVLNGITFGNTMEKYIELGSPKHVDILYSADLNEWPKDNFTVQLKVKDIRLSK